MKRAEVFNGYHVFLRFQLMKREFQEFIYMVSAVRIAGDRMVEKTKAMAALFGLLVFASLALIIAGGLGFAAEGQATGAGNEVKAAAPAALSCGEAGCGSKAGAACGGSVACGAGCDCKNGGSCNASCGCGCQDGSCGAACGCGDGKCTGGCECQKGVACTGTCGCGSKSGATCGAGRCGKAAPS